MIALCWGLDAPKSRPAAHPKAIRNPVGGLEARPYHGLFLLDISAHQKVSFVELPIQLYICAYAAM